ncbi:MAG: hypothetical protein WCF26_22420 [Candidatus Sulfotelmatobacter sp.]
MLSRRSAGAVLVVSFLMLSGLAAADEGDLFRGTGEGLTATNFDLTLSASSPILFESRLTDGILFSGAFSQPAIWTLAILAHGTHGYVLTAVVTGTGASGFTGVDIQSTTATPTGYFSGPMVLASNPVPTSFVAEPSTASFLITGILFAAGMLRRRVFAC